MKIEIDKIAKNVLFTSDIIRHQSCVGINISILFPTKEEMIKISELLYDKHVYFSDDWWCKNNLIHHKIYNKFYIDEINIKPREQIDLILSFAPLPAEVYMEVMSKGQSSANYIFDRYVEKMDYDILKVVNENFWDLIDDKTLDKT